MKPVKLLGIILLIGLLNGCAAVPEPVQESLVRVKVSRWGGTVSGEDFLISVTPEQIEFVDAFTPEGDQITGEEIAITPDQWDAIETAVFEITLEEDIPQAPAFFDKLREWFVGKLEVLDGSSTTSLYLTWEGEAGTREGKYLWPNDSSAAGLWDVLYDLAQSKATTVPLEGE